MGSIVSEIRQGELWTMSGPQPFLLWLSFSLFHDCREIGIFSLLYFSAMIFLLSYWSQRYYSPWTETSETISQSKSFLFSVGFLRYVVTVMKSWLAQTKRELHSLLAISLRQFLVEEEGLAYVIHVLDVILHLPYKPCHFLPHHDN